MKTYLHLYGLFALLLLGMMSCSKTEHISPTEDLKFQELFEPAADAHPREKYLFEKYHIWIRMDFKDSREVYNSYLGQDVNNSRFPPAKVDDDKRSSAYNYMDSLLANLSPAFIQELMPNEIFFVKSYGHPLWGYQFNIISRTRLAFVWPNATYNALPQIDETNHYYRDTVFTREVWRQLADIIGQRLPEEIPGFEQIGKPYDAGTAFNKIRDQYFIDYDLNKRNQDWQKLADQGGYLDPYSSVSFKAEYAAFLKLILLESAENIQKNYIRGNKMKQQKYELFLKYYQDRYKWDVQASGNRFRSRIATNP